MQTDGFTVHCMTEGLFASVYIRGVGAMNKALHCVGEISPDLI